MTGGSKNDNAYIHSRFQSISITFEQRFSIVAFFSMLITPQRLQFGLASDHASWTCSGPHVAWRTKKTRRRYSTAVMRGLFFRFTEKAVPPLLLPRSKIYWLRKSSRLLARSAGCRCTDAVKHNTSIYSSRLHTICAFYKISPLGYWVLSFFFKRRSPTTTKSSTIPHFVTSLPNIL